MRDGYRLLSFWRSHKTRQTDVAARRQTTIIFLIAAILAYPWLLAIFHATGQVAMTDSDSDIRGLAWIGSALSISLVFGVPLSGLIVARRHSSNPLSDDDLFVRRVAHLTFAAPPLFTATGVFLLVFDVSGMDQLVWSFVWLVILAILLRSSGSPTKRRQSTGEPPKALRWLHGLGAAGLITMFLAGHLANHLFAVLGSDAHKAVMNFLRLWYRSAFVEPAIIGGFFVMIGSGLMLARYRTKSFIDTLGTIQTLTGALLAGFLISHMTAVLVLARWKSEIETDWLYATGDPAGLFADPWNVRLIPHYSLAVACVVAHAFCGLRVILLAHGTTLRKADWAAWAGCIAGIMLSFFIMMTMLGVRI